MSPDDTSTPPPDARPPHPATVPHEHAVQPKIGEERPPHPAVAQRQTAAPAKSRKARGPHLATVKRGSAQPKKAAAAKPPHPATVKRGSAAQPKKAGGDKPPHPATISRGARSTVQPMSKSRAAKAGKQGGIVAFLNGNKKPITATNKDQPSGHAERIALAKAPPGDIIIEQNAWPCSDCHTWLAQESEARGIAITLQVTDDQGSQSVEHKAEGVRQGDTGTILYTDGTASISVAGT